MSAKEQLTQNTCGACEGAGTQFPTSIDNLPGLSAIAYRIGTHNEFVSSLHARLSSKDSPALSKLRTRDDDDFSIALLDAYSCVADVLSFYQERIANESYLRTATERGSLRELARLIGYRLKPGVAAETYLAFTMQEPPQQVASTDPRQASGVPEKATLNVGLKVQSVPGPGETPQIFETVESIEARPEWNVLRPRLAEHYLPQAGRTDAYLQGTNLNLKPGDGLLFIGREYLKKNKKGWERDKEEARTTEKPGWQFRLISKVYQDSANHRTHITLNDPLAEYAPGAISLTLRGPSPQVYVFRKKAAIFGHNAPDWIMPTNMKKAYTPDAADEASTREPGWRNFTLGPDAGTVDLDGLYTDVTPHSDEMPSWLVLVSAPDPAIKKASQGKPHANARGANEQPARKLPPSEASKALFKVSSVDEVSRAAFGIAAKITRVYVEGDEYATFEKLVRETSVYVVSQELELSEAPDTSAVHSGNMVLDRNMAALSPGRKLIVTGRKLGTGEESTELVTLKTVSKTPDGFPQLIFDDQENLVNSYQRETVCIYANVARATHGETVRQILGSGAARLAYQRFPLGHAPLTYVGAENEIGAEAALEVRINDVRWHEAPTLYSAGTNDRTYVLKIGEDGAATLQFGDGRHGARLPTGQENVRATYRKGMGAGGNLKPGQLSQLLTRPLGLKAVSNPQPALGGVDADSIEKARRSMPLGVRTLGRLVSLKDYEDYARAFTGIAKAQAVVLNTCAGRTVFVTVAGDNGEIPPDSTLTQLLQALKRGGDPLAHCELAPYRKAPFSLALRIKYDADHQSAKVITDTEAALRAAFSFDAREFGQPVSRSEVMAVAQKVEGVLGVALDRFSRAATNAAPEEPLMPAGAKINAQRSPIAAELLLLDPGPLDIKEMP